MSIMYIKENLMKIPNSTITHTKGILQKRGIMAIMHI